MEKIKSRQVLPKDYLAIKGPVITEKSAMSGNLVIKVDHRLSKTEIKEAVEKALEVRVKKVRTQNKVGKPKRSMKGVGRRSRSKIAYITLHEGEQLNIIEGL